MDLFSFLFKKPVIINDEFFGVIKFESRGKKDSASYFSTEDFPFSPTGRRIGCYIDADLSGPTPAQRAFFEQIEKKYAALTEALIPVIEDGFEGWQQDFKIESFEAEFWLVGISIPCLDAQPVEWNWSFETVHGVNHMLTIYMHDDIPQPGVQFDG